MIFHFSDLETLRIALTSGQVPLEVALAPARVSFDVGSGLSVKSDVAPPKAMQTALKRLGVKVAKAHLAEPIAVSCWPEIVPVVQATDQMELASTVPVLFDIPSHRLADLATEMLRLGNDRQSFRHVTAGGEERVLLRVIGPPYYTLLGALDRSQADVIAYVEKAPRVWVELGFRHPMQSGLQAPAGRILMLRAPRVWKALDEGPFQDIYEVLDFQLPRAAISYTEGKLESKLSVPMRLAPGDAAEAPEMWVLKDNAIELFDAFVRDADDRLTARLIFAVTNDADDDPTIVLRVRQLLKLAPPTIELTGAIGYTRYRKLNNLFVPAGARLHPTLRRDAARQMLAPDEARIVWLTPLGDGRFAPESLPDQAFQPLEDWVEYVIDRERDALKLWVQASTFDFESFICRDELTEQISPGGPSKPSAPKMKPSSGPDDSEDAPTDEGAKNQQEFASQAMPPETEASSAAPVVPNEFKKRRQELEQTFLAIKGPIETPERTALWPELARLNMALDDYPEAAICWFNALWQRDDLPAEWLADWLRVESKQSTPDLSAVAIDRELTCETPAQGEFRRFIVLLLYGCTRSPFPAAIRERLPAIRRYLEKHDDNIGIRAVWLTWRHLTRASGDVLGLARVRDRLFDQLFTRGLNQEYDLPRFIRIADDADGTRLREVLDRSLRIREAARKWITLDSPRATEINRAYADLMLAFGFASLRDMSQSRELLTSSQATLSQVKDSARDRDGAHALLLDGFRFRIGQALAGSPHRGPLPHAWQQEFFQFRERVNSLKGNDQRKVSPFVVERFREQSTILEPDTRLNPYHWHKKGAHAWIAEIVAISEIHDPAVLAPRIKNLLFDRKKSKYDLPTQLEIAIDLLPMCVRVSADFMRAALAQVTPLILENVDSSGLPAGSNIFLPGNLARLLERAMILAVSYEVPEFIKRFAEQFDRLLDLKSDEALFDVINVGAAQCIRSLRKSGRNDEIHALLIRIDAAIEGRVVKSRLAGAKSRVDLLCARLQVAGARLYLGKMSEALPALDETRDFLYANSPFKSDRPWHQEYARLARTYIGALAHAQIPFALDRVEELFKKMAKVANTFTTATHYSRLHLNVIEEFVVRFMQPNSLLGATARRWLDDDEYLIRRRIHDEMNGLLKQNGL